MSFKILFYIFLFCFERGEAALAPTLVVSDLDSNEPTDIGIFNNKVSYKLQCI